MCFCEYYIIPLATKGRFPLMEQFVFAKIYW